MAGGPKTACDVCGKTFKTASACGSHKYRAHKIKPVRLRKFACHCGQFFRSEKALRVHVSRFHPIVTTNTPMVLQHILKDKHTIPDMMDAISEWLKSGTPVDGQLPKETLDYLKKEDARIQLALRLIAIIKVQRVLGQEARMKILNDALDKRLSDQRWLDKASGIELATMLERIYNFASLDLAYIKDVHSLTQINVGDVVDKLAQIFGTGVAGKGSDLLSFFQVTGIKLPDKPHEREQLRQMLQADIESGKLSFDEEPTNQGDQGK